ncbi:heavy metal translocating P-type ATPase [Cohnella nanjingensis]|uniref:Cadmium-translocating P-type ATPase n=1 Tax=Cohnella nanjingensis TaxID=1387779 RepID=A0A7X0VD42_9BACL|nr:heavy metal translocating P-type ATPase [Cohnella nanjingensis]MBB6669296.1 cadmium-translocating P-type ATPase [Cohnella nanjingensis]
MQTKEVGTKTALSKWVSLKGEAMAAAACGVLLALGWGIGYVAHGAATILYGLAMLVGGYAKAKEGLQTLIKEKEIDVNLLMIVAAIGAACIGYGAEGAMLILIFAASGAMETYAMEKSARDISKLKELKPETGVLYLNGQETVVPIEQLRVGDLLIVKPGERIPTDGVVQSGASAVNQASITGESIPMDKQKGDEVYGGTINGQGALYVEVTRGSESTLFAKIIKLVQEAQQEMPKSQRFVERFERIYARIVIGVTLLLLVLPPYAFGWSWQETGYRAMVFLVVASPCALVASIMPAMLSAISNCARKGLLFKGGAHLENLSRVKVIAFDKTGTLTEGRPVVTDLVPYRAFTEEEVLQAAASLECLSTHPLARAVVDEARKRGVPLDRPDDFEALTSWGVQASLNGERWKVGKAGLMDPSFLLDAVVLRAQQLEAAGKTVVMVQNSAGIVGIIGLQDRIREQTKRAIEELRKVGIASAMITGDQRVTADAIAKEAGIDLVFSELLPEDKVNMVKQLKQTYGHVAMVGDGVNDAPALAVSSVGIAMGVAGSDAALETADLVLMNDDLLKIKEAVMLGRKMGVVVKQNMAFAIAVILLLIFGNLWSGIALPLGVVGHEGSTILVILNGLRLLVNGNERGEE